MERIKVGVIGVSGIGYGAHLPAYENIPDEVEIVAACDIDGTQLKKAGVRFGIPRLYADFKEMLALKDLDAVSICTPNYLHAPMTIEALKAGKHVLCEKPMALNSGEARQMVAAARENNRILMIALNNRFSDESVQLKQLIDAGELGEIYSAKTGWVRRRGVPKGWFGRKRYSGGGPLIDLGVHMLDLSWWLMGSPRLESVLAATYSKIACHPEGTPESGKDPSTDFDVEDSAFAFLRFSNESSLMLSVSWALNTGAEEKYCELYGTKGGATWFPLTVHTQYGGRLMDSRIQTQGPSGHSGAVRHFISCIREGRQPISSGEEHLQVMQMLEAIYLSAETGREVREPYQPCT